MSISSLEAELNRQRAINRELRQELNEIASGVLSGYQALEQCNRTICDTLNNSHQKLEGSHSRELSSIEMQAEIDKMYVKFKQMELANKKIRECNNKKYYDFANYRTVRKLVQGMMDNLDVHMVSDAVIYKSVEAQQLKTPDYWLTCVLIAVMAWKNDDRPLAERAIQIALEMDKKNSAVFFMLFNLRMQRDDAALKWFLTYQECPLKGSDQRTFLVLFALVGKTVNQSEELSSHTREKINRFIRDVIEANLHAEGYDEAEMVQRVQTYYDRMDGRETLAYPLLQKHCTDFSSLATAMNKAKGNVEILTFLKSVIHVGPAERNAFIKNFVDELIAQANPSEQEVYDEIRYNELVIRYQGEVEQAKAAFEAEQTHDESGLNLIAEMITWVFSGNPEEVNGQSRLNMFSLTKDIQYKAVLAHTAAYRAINTTQLPITIEEYSTKVNFSDPSGEENKLRQFYEEKRAAKLVGIKNWPAYVGFGVAAAAAIGSFFTSFALLLLTLVSAGYGAITLLSNRSVRKRIEAECANMTASSMEILRHLFEEHRAYQEEWSSYDAYNEQIEAEFAQL